MGVRVCTCVCVRECGTGNFPLVPRSLVDKHASLLKQTVVGGEPPRARLVYGPGGAPQPKRVSDGKFRPVRIPCLRPLRPKVRTDCSGVFALLLSMSFDLLQLIVLLRVLKGRERSLAAGQTALQLKVDDMQCSTCRKKRKRCASMHATLCTCGVDLKKKVIKSVTWSEAEHVMGETR